MQPKTILAVAMASGLLAAGCGDDDDSTGGESPSITKDEWIAQADQICREGDATVNRAAGEFFAGAKPGTPAFAEKEAQFGTEVVVPNLEEQIEGVSALSAPAGDEDEIEAIISAAEAGLEEVKADPAALDSPDSSLAEASELLAAYGAKVCGT